MTKEQRQERKARLALALVQGRSVAAWAHENHVPRSTAYRWAGQPDVQAAAESSRRRACNRVLGRLARRAYCECYQVAKLAECAESESVRLRALRSIFDVISVSKFAELRRRMAAIEEGLRDRTDIADLSCTSGPCTVVDRRLKNSETRPDSLI